MLRIPDIKKILSIIGLSAVLALNPAIALAQTASPLITPKNSAGQAERLANLHSVCDTQVANRVDLLNRLLVRVNGLKRLSANEKSQFSSEIQTDINNLNQIKTKCDSDTTLPILRADVRTIYTNLRIYAVFAPQVRLLVAADSLDYVDGLLAGYSTKLQFRINQQGNPANLTSLLNDMNAKISDAQTQYTNAENLILPLNPASYPNSNQVLQNARTDIRNGASDLRSAWQDAIQIRQGLKSLGGTSITSSPSPTP